VSEHLEKTKQALSRIPNITDISVEGDDDGLSVGYGNPVDLPDIDDDHSFFPGYVGVSVKIDIYIPQRLQNRLTRLPAEVPVTLKFLY
jgi:hypothetical protein